MCSTAHIAEMLVDSCLDCGVYAVRLYAVAICFLDYHFAACHRFSEGVLVMLLIKVCCCLTSMTLCSVWAGDCINVCAHDFVYQQRHCALLLLPGKRHPQTVPKLICSHTSYGWDCWLVKRCLVP